MGTLRGPQRREEGPVRSRYSNAWSGTGSGVETIGLDDTQDGGPERVSSLPHPGEDFFRSAGRLCPASTETIAMPSCSVAWNMRSIP